MKIIQCSTLMFSFIIDPVTVTFDHDHKIVVPRRPPGGVIAIKVCFFDLVILQAIMAGLIAHGVGFLGGAYPCSPVRALKLPISLTRSPARTRVPRALRLGRSSISRRPRPRVGTGTSSGRVSLGSGRGTSTDYL